MVGEKTHMYFNPEVNFTHAPATPSPPGLKIPPYAIFGGHLGDIGIKFPNILLIFNKFRINQRIQNFQPN